jgi:hypothetical protein
LASKRFNPTIIEEGLGAAGIAFTVVSSPVLRPWYRKWGANDAEVAMSLPGDDLVSQPRLESTRAITIHAPAAAVWPWLVQMGQGRGGLYSYERLENLAGCQMDNADRILPQCQDLKIGDLVRLGREGFPAFEVMAIEPGQAIILGGDPAGTGAPTLSWVFYLEPVEEKTSRLMARIRQTYQPGLGAMVTWRVVTDPLWFMMERKMLQGIKLRAEALQPAATAGANNSSRRKCHE